MEDTIPTQTTEKTAADNQSEQKDSIVEASYTSPEHQEVSPCDKSSEGKQKDKQAEEYYDSELVYNQLRQVAAMSKRIVQDCEMFEDSPTVEQILKEVNAYQGKADELSQRVKNSINSGMEQYRRSSSDLYNQSLKIKSELLDSDMCRSYSWLYVKHHFEAMFISNKEGNGTML